MNSISITLHSRQTGILCCRTLPEIQPQNNMANFSDLVLVVGCYYWLLQQCGLSTQVVTISPVSPRDLGHPAVFQSSFYNNVNIIPYLKKYARFKFCLIYFHIVLIVFLLHHNLLENNPNHKP